MSKIIVAAPPIPGELSPLLYIAKGLAERGHHITVVTGSGVRAQVEQAGLAFVPVSGRADFDAAAVTGSPQRAKPAPGPEMLAEAERLHAAFAIPQIRQPPLVEQAMGTKPQALLRQLDAACHSADGRERAALRSGRLWYGTRASTPRCGRWVRGLRRLSSRRSSRGWAPAPRSLVPPRTSRARRRSGPAR